MAFFTRVNLNVPILPPEDLGTDNTCPMASHTQHRRYASEPVTSAHGIINSTMRPNSIPGAGASSAARSSSGVADRNASGIIITNVNEDEMPVMKNTDKPVNAKGRPATESSAQNPENGESEAPSKSTEKNGAEGNGEPAKRYEYVVDRVLGVEV